MDAQLKRGLTEVCVLLLLARGDSYGYRLANDAQRLMPLSESTLYPVLKRLEEGGAVDSYTTQHQGRLRRYYRITQEGLQQLREFAGKWEKLGQIYDEIVRTLAEQDKQEEKPDEA